MFGRLALVCLLYALGSPALAQLIVHEVRIDANQGGLDMPIPAASGFAAALAHLGDIDGDGVTDLAVGVPSWDDNRDPENTLELAGEVAVLLMNADRSVRETIVIRTGENGFVGRPTMLAQFGFKLAGLGDLDGDGTPDLAVGAPGGQLVAGSLWILFLNPDGTVKAEREIDGADFNVGGQASFGRGLALLGDEDGDGLLDIAVGSWDKLYRVSIDTDGSAGSVNLIATGISSFGYAVANLGDLDGNGITDLAVGEPFPDRVHVVFRSDYDSELSRVSISANLNGAWEGAVSVNPDFGRGLTTIDDLDGNGIRELVAGAPGDDSRFGVVWLIMLDENATITGFRRIARDTGTISAAPQSGFGWSLTPIGDTDGNGIADLAAGMNTVLYGGGRGAIWQLFLSCGDDCDGNGVGDECRGFADCNGNFAPDTCDTSLGVSADCNGDRVPDECQEHGLVDLGNAVRFGRQSSARAVARPKLYFKQGAELCIEVLLKVDEGGLTGTALRKGFGRRNYSLELDAGHVAFTYDTVSDGPRSFVTEAPVVAPAAWTHVSLSHTFGRDDTKLFINGQGVPGTWNAPPVEPPATEVAGDVTLYVGSSFDGVIDEVRIWGVRRSAASVRLDMTRPVPPDHPDLRGYWRFDEGSGVSTEDLAGNARLGLELPTWTRHIACVPCPGDLTGDGRVDLNELAIVLASFGQTGFALPGDANGDGAVDLADLALVLARFGEACW